jgi:hypothetical protein
MKRIVFALGLAVLVGCGGGDDKKDDGGGEASSSEGSLPVFSLATSEYPSWSTFMVADKLGLIDGAVGKTGELEKKYGVDIQLKVADYDTCIQYYGNATTDAACLTNMDSLNPAMTRATTIICPTSTSSGGDQVIAVGVDDIDGLKGTKVYGLSKSVSEYTFRRGLEVSGKDPTEFTFTHLDPGPAATALQTGSSDVKAICVWNPYALSVTDKNKDAKAVFTSELIKGEILDCVVVGNDSLQKPKSKEFCLCMLEAFYEVSRRLDDPKTEKDTTTALGEDFSSLSYEQMKDTVLKQTLFYKTPSDGSKLFASKELKATMKQVVKTCGDIGVLEDGKSPTISYGGTGAQLTFDSQYMDALSK